MRTPIEILTDGDQAECHDWIKHQLSGDWFTSDLVRLFFHADESNFAQLAGAFPWVAAMVRWYKDGHRATIEHIRAVAKASDEWGDITDEEWAAFLRAIDPERSE